LAADLKRARQKSPYKLLALAVELAAAGSSGHRPRAGVALSFLERMEERAEQLGDMVPATVSKRNLGAARTAAFGLQAMVPVLAATRKQGTRAGLLTAGLVNRYVALERKLETRLNGLLRMIKRADPEANPDVAGFVARARRSHRRKRKQAWREIRKMQSDLARMVEAALCRRPQLAPQPCRGSKSPRKGGSKSPRGEGASGSRQNGV
jgi:hypothetical protein